jgi:hypothetical protein
MYHFFEGKDILLKIMKRNTFNIIGLARVALVLAVLALLGVEV